VGVEVAVYKLSFADQCCSVDIYKKGESVRKEKGEAGYTSALQCPAEISLGCPVLVSLPGLPIGQ
jgi:hypothetical protein